MQLFVLVRCLHVLLPFRLNEAQPAPTHSRTSFHVRITVPAVPVSVLQYYQLVLGLAIVLYLSPFVAFALVLLFDCVNAYGPYGNSRRTMWTFSEPAVQQAAVFASANGFDSPDGRQVLCDMRFAL